MDSLLKLIEITPFQRMKSPILHIDADAIDGLPVTPQNTNGQSASSRLHMIWALRIHQAGNQRYSQDFPARLTWWLVHYAAENEDLLHRG